MVYFIRKLAHIKCPRKLATVIRGASKDEMLDLIHTCKRILRKEIPLSSCDRSKVVKNRRFLRHLINPGYSLNSKKKYLLQKGGAVPAVIGKVGSVLAKVGRIAVKAAGKGVKFA